jgi:hypothetical protein
MIIIIVLESVRRSVLRLYPYKAAGDVRET